MIYFIFQKQQTHFYWIAKYHKHIYCQFIFNVRILFTLLFKRLAIQANSCTLFYEMQCTNLHSFWYGSNLVFSEVLKGFELYECLFYLFIQIDLWVGTVSVFCEPTLSVVSLFSWLSGLISQYSLRSLVSEQTQLQTLAVNNSKKHTDNFQLCYILYNFNQTCTYLDCFLLYQPSAMFLFL